MQITLTAPRCFLIPYAAQARNVLVQMASMEQPALVSDVGYMYFAKAQ